jgi:hypothetical protein
LQASGVGPPGDISYPAGSETDAFNDTYISIGGWKEASRADEHPFFRGWLDELRFSSGLRYPINGGFAPPSAAFAPDSRTMALFHFNEGAGDIIVDSAGTASTASAARLFGGSTPGPEWQPSNLFMPIQAKVFLPWIP